ncbi:SAM-dependent methyltransferase [Glycomyces salinus]|uniref:SAM-dependent methyltransferase n=1 Tax=Glycomyces salinus TaxID=980294 RepID=UPI0018EBE761|nr:SAM-dependent methyltransferase [Glycomyces salinus]
MSEPSPVELPPEVDTNVPSTARVYDALLGGTDNFEVDREAAEVFIRHVPQAQVCAHENRSALIRGVEYLVRAAGIDQLLDIGCGLPSGKNTHQAAQEINPDARVVYVDHDPMVVAHGRAMLEGNPGAVIVHGELRDPDAIMDDPAVRAGLDFDRPIALMVIGMIMQISDDERPNDILASLMDRLPSGSRLFITSWPDTGEPQQHALSRACIETLGNGWCRPVEELRKHFLGMELDPPGLEYIARWFPENPDGPVRAVEDLEPYERTQMAGIAVNA